MKQPQKRLRLLTQHTKSAHQSQSFPQTNISKQQIKLNFGNIVTQTNTYLNNKQNIMGNSLKSKKNINIYNNSKQANIPFMTNNQNKTNCNRLSKIHSLKQKIQIPTKQAVLINQKLSQINLVQKTTDLQKVKFRIMKSAKKYKQPIKQQNQQQLSIQQISSHESHCTDITNNPDVNVNADADKYKININTNININNPNTNINKPNISTNININTNNNHNNQNDNDIINEQIRQQSFASSYTSYFSSSLYTQTQITNSNSQSSNTNQTTIKIPILSTPPLSPISPIPQKFITNKKNQIKKFNIQQYPALNLIDIDNTFGYSQYNININLNSNAQIQSNSNINNISIQDKTNKNNNNNYNTNYYYQPNLIPTTTSTPTPTNNNHNNNNSYLINNLQNTINKLQQLLHNKYIKQICLQNKIKQLQSQNKQLKDKVNQIQNCIPLCIQFNITYQNQYNQIIDNISDDKQNNVHTQKIVKHNKSQQLQGKQNDIQQITKIFIQKLQHLEMVIVSQNKQIQLLCNRITIKKQLNKDNKNKDIDKDKDIDKNQYQIFDQDINKNKNKNKQQQKDYNINTSNIEIGKYQNR